MNDTSVIVPHQKTRSVISEFMQWFHSNKVLFFAIFVLIAGAFIVRLFTFDRYLPYADWSDEGVYLATALDMRGVEDHSAMRIRFGDYPPVYLQFNALTQNIQDVLKPHNWLLHHEYYYLLRSAAVLFGVITTGLIVTIGWQLAGQLAGLAAASIWAFAPVIVDKNSLALPDPLMYLFTAAAITTALRAWKTYSPRWLLFSLIIGIFSIYTKYWNISAVLPFCVVALVLFKDNRRKMLPWIILYGAIAAISVLYLFVAQDALNSPNREFRDFKSQGLALALSIDRNINNWQFAILPLGFHTFVVAVVGGVLAYIYNRKNQAKVINLTHIMMLLAYCVLTIMLAASFTNVHLDKIRHVYPTTIALLPIWGAALAQIIWGFQTLVQQYTKLNPLRPAVAIIVLAIVFITLAPVYIEGNLDLIKQYQRTHVVEAVRSWADDNVPMDGIVLRPSLSDLDRIYNRAWGGYAGYKQFPTWGGKLSEIIESTPQDFVDDNIMYFVFSDKDKEQHYSDPGFDRFVDQLTLVKTFSTSDNALAGSTTYFYRMQPPLFKADFNYGNQIKLVGYDLSTTSLKSGEVFLFRPYWNRGEQPPTTNYSMFIHIYPLDEIEILSQYDAVPTIANRPTLTWNDVDELYIGADFPIIIPEDILPGQYRLAIGLYDSISGARLRSSDGSEFYEIMLEVIE